MAMIVSMSMRPAKINLNHKLFRGNNLLYSNMVIICCLVPFDDCPMKGLGKKRRIVKNSGTGQ